MAEKNRNVAVYRLLIGSFSSIVLLFIAFGVISLVEIRTLSDVTRTIYNHPLVVSNASLGATVSMIKIHRSMKDVALFDFPTKINITINSMNEQERMVFKSLDIVKDKILGDEGQKLENETRHLFVTWKPIREEVIKLVSKGQREEAAKITIGKGADHVAKLENKMLELSSYARNKATGFILLGEKVRSRIMKTTIILISIGLLLSVFIAFFTIRRTQAAEEALRESEDRFRNLIEGSIQGILIHRNHKPLFINQMWADMHGYMVEEILKMESVVPLMSIQDQARMVEYKKARLRGEYVPADYDYQGVRKDGSLVWLENRVMVVTWHGQPAIQTMIYDISMRKKAEEGLRESEERYRSLIELNPDGIYVCREGKIIYTNQAAIDIWGAKSEDEVIGKTVFDLIHPDYREKAKERSRLVAEKGISVPLTDFKYHRLDKGETHVQAIASPVIFGGKPAVLSTIRDITKQRKAEMEKEGLENQLQQAQKMEAIGTLAGGIAHDFNNILSPIMIHSEMAMMDLPPDSPIRYSLEQIFKAGERARDMIKQVLAFSRQRQEEKAPIKIGFILKEVVRLLRSSIPTTIDIRHSIETEADTVIADPTQIHQVLLNLCTNASYDMREKGGVLEIELDDLNLDSETVSQFEDLNPGSYLRLTVKDTGHGIDPEVIERIFEPYFTTKGVGEGTGMGLAVVHGIVKSHGGYITAKSELGKGTTFQILFPKYEEDIPKVSEPTVRFHQGTERILFVDDEKAVVDAIQSMLENLGYKVTGRTSSIEALEAFRNNPQGFDLVITDMTMPNMTGKDLAKELMSIRQDISIILCTGFSDQIDEKIAKKMGISTFVMKPIVMRDMANTIREVLDKK
jgi:PAS domain S-box-containing protein